MEDGEAAGIGCIGVENIGELISSPANIWAVRVTDGEVMVVTAAAVTPIIVKTKMAGEVDNGVVIGGVTYEVAITVASTTRGCWR